MHTFSLQFKRPMQWLLAAICLLTAIFSIDITGISFTVPYIAHDLQLNLLSMQWMVNAFTLSAAFFMVFVYQWKHNVSHRKLFLTSAGLFAAGSVLMGIASNVTMLIIGRVLQGVAFGIGYNSIMSLIYQNFPQEKKIYAIQSFIITTCLALASGPLIVSVIVVFLSWRWLFLINAFLSLCILFIIKKTCSLDAVLIKKTTIDYKGATLLLLGLILFIFPLNQIQNWQITSPLFWILLLIGILVLGCFFFIEKYTNHPLINFNFFKNRNFLLHTIIRAITQLIVAPLLFFIPLFLINISHYYTLSAALLMLSMTLAIGVISASRGKWIGRIGTQKPAIISMLAFMSASVIFYFIGPNASIWQLISALFLAGIGAGFSFVATLAGVTRAFSTKPNEGNALYFTVALISSTLGISIVAAFISMLSKIQIVLQLLSQKISLTPEQFSTIKKMTNSILANVPSNLPAGTSSGILKMINTAYLFGFQIVMVFIFIAAIVGLIASLLLKPEKTIKIQ